MVQSELQDALQTFASSRDNGNWKQAAREYRQFFLVGHGDVATIPNLKIFGLINQTEHGIAILPFTILRYIITRSTCKAHVNLRMKSHNPSPPQLIDDEQKPWVYVCLCSCVEYSVQTNMRESIACVRYSTVVCASRTNFLKDGV